MKIELQQSHQVCWLRLAYEKVLNVQSLCGKILPPLPPPAPPPPPSPGLNGVSSPQPENSIKSSLECMLHEPLV